MRTVSLRMLARDYPGIQEPALITHKGRIIGKWLPAHDGMPALIDGGMMTKEDYEDLKQTWEENTPRPYAEPEFVGRMEATTVKDLSKELGKEAPKPEPRGRVSKGLGEIPGSNPPSEDMMKSWEKSKPSPKK